MNSESKDLRGLEEITPPQIIFSNPKKERTRRFFEHITLKDIGAGL